MLTLNGLTLTINSLICTYLAIVFFWKEQIPTAVLLKGQSKMLER